MSPVTHATSGASKPATRHASQSASISTSSSVKATISPAGHRGAEVAGVGEAGAGLGCVPQACRAGEGQVEGLPHTGRGRPVVDDDDLEAGIGLDQGVAERVVQAAARPPAGRDHDGGHRRDRRVPAPAATSTAPRRDRLSGWSVRRPASRPANRPANRPDRPGSASPGRGGGPAGSGRGSDPASADQMASAMRPASSPSSGRRTLTMPRGRRCSRTRIRSSS